MNSLDIWYPLFWAVCGGLAAFALIMIEIIIEDYGLFVTKRRTRLRDKLHFAMMQQRGAV